MNANVGRSDADGKPGPVVVAGVYLVSAGLAFVNLMEAIPSFDGLVHSPVFPFLHEPLELAALMVALLSAHAVSPPSGRGVMVVFVLLSIPHTLADFPAGLPQLIRLLFTAVGGFFGVQLIAARKKMEFRLSELVHSDPLTAVANSRHFRSELERELAWHRRYGTCGAVLFLDLDGFKGINDRFGHAVGDQILRGVATRLQREVRETDLLARMGGDEFAVLLPNTSTDQAQVVGERLLSTVGSINPRLDDPALRLSASFGLARYPENGVSAENLVTAADQAMYLAKQDGGGKIVVSDRPPTSESIG